METCTGIQHTENDNDCSKSILTEIINKGQNGRGLKTEETDHDINKRLTFENTHVFPQTITPHSKEDYADYK